ncbi:kinase-like protein [Rhizoclosmatium globosum]|uniref:non-specific serine/threonine protein kinase n=1 Tax=Rhizoclosmatium globosum TaxID=329046 RepID=A0A1Y2BI13_9FUNG|nr:kinase-like protein [Rhizoclosmatium globosum]|eukprot:ORY34413.1 kinase-like protein [Rhizoclosmatium globosum]
MADVKLRIKHLHIDVSVLVDAAAVAAAENLQDRTKIEALETELAALRSASTSTPTASVPVASTTTKANVWARLVPFDSEAGIPLVLDNSTDMTFIGLKKDGTFRICDRKSEPAFAVFHRRAESGETYTLRSLCENEFAVDGINISLNQDTYLVDGSTIDFEDGLIGGVFWFVLDSEAILSQFSSEFVIQEQFGKSGVLGTGGFGTVCAYLEKATGKIVAVKECMKILWQYDGGHILHIVMEFVNGPDVDVWMQGLGRSVNKLECVEIISQVVAGVSALHARQIIHRDIKPANTLISFGNLEKICIKITDFGCGTTDTSPTSIIGSEALGAPEQFLGTPYNSSVDIRAVGAFIYRLELSKYPPKNLPPLTQADPRFDFVSKKCFVSLSRTLFSMPEMRITANQLLHHTYLQNKPVPSVQHSPDISYFLHKIKHGNPTQVFHIIETKNPHAFLISSKDLDAAGALNRNGMKKVLLQQAVPELSLEENGFAFRINSSVYEKVELDVYAAIRDIILQN